MKLRRAAVTSTLLLLAPLAACGGDEEASSAPEDASTEEFCEAYNSLYESLMSASPAEGEDPQEAAVAALQDWVERMQEVGTPDELPDDARAGYELILDTASEIDENSSMEDLQGLGGDLSAEEQEQATAFTTWAQEECPMETPELGLPSDAPTDAPSDTATDTPSDAPSDTPSDMTESETP
ncbi:hypothetical protein [Nocardioides sp. SYSU DS0663]|uniref:hypothetical protein n=1 Tax=Nocardioides sp. SYSU DS0663 TaxID=3416445 RepID=UPI003F4C58AE